jgi:hypothetical protein
LLALWVLVAVLFVREAQGQPIADEWVLVVPLFGYAAVGALVAARQPGNAVGWLLLGIALMIALGSLGDSYIQTRANPGYLAVAWVDGWLFNVWLMLIVGFLPLLFPDGRLLSRRWRPVLWLAVATCLTQVLTVALAPGELAVTASIENPLGVEGPLHSVLVVVSVVSWCAFVVTAVLTSASLVMRFRRSTATGRQQVKWFAFAGLTTIAGLLTSALGESLPKSWGDPIGAVGWVVFLVACIGGIPIATGIAILRHRLYDIDVVINRTLVYLTLSTALAATYVGSVLLLRLVLGPLAGESALAVAGSTLAVAALFRPARARIQAIVDRRFYRSRYDATRTLDEFAHRLRHELDLDAVGADLCAAADRTVQPSHISLWLRP